MDSLFWKRDPYDIQDSDALFMGKLICIRSRGKEGLQNSRFKRRQRYLTAKIWSTNIRQRLAG